MTTTAHTAHTCRLIFAGQVDYQAAWEWQRRLISARSTGGDDTVLLLEHPPTITLGNKADPGNILLDRAELERRGVAVVQSDRGGDVTYHAPGQLVGYPILKLGPLGIGVVDYMRALEEVIIRTIGDYGILGERVAGLTGVWVRGGTAKIAAIGVKYSAAGITSHGFALNINPELHGFAQIVPCGISDRSVTSLAHELGAAPAWDAVVARVCHHLATVLNLRLEVTAP